MDAFRENNHKRSPPRISIGPANRSQPPGSDLDLSVESAVRVKECGFAKGRTCLAAAAIEKKPVAISIVTIAEAVSGAVAPPRRGIASHSAAVDRKAITMIGRR